MCQRIDPLIERLLYRLDEPDPTVRRNALGALRLNGERAAPAIPAISRLLEDTDPHVRGEAQRALRRLGAA